MGWASIPGGRPCWREEDCLGTESSSVFRDIGPGVLAHWRRTLPANICRSPRKLDGPKSAEAGDKLGQQSGSCLPFDVLALGVLFLQRVAVVYFTNIHAGFTISVFARPTSGDISIDLLQSQHTPDR